VKNFSVKKTCAQEYSQNIVLSLKVIVIQLYLGSAQKWHRSTLKGIKRRDQALRSSWRRETPCSHVLYFRAMSGHNLLYMRSDVAKEMSRFRLPSSGRRRLLLKVPNKSASCLLIRPSLSLTKQIRSFSRTLTLLFGPGLVTGEVWCFNFCFCFYFYPNISFQCNQIQYRCSATVSFSLIRSEHLLDFFSRSVWKLSVELTREFYVYHSMLFCVIPVQSL